MLHLAAWNACFATGGSGFLSVFAGGYTTRVATIIKPSGNGFEMGLGGDGPTARARLPHGVLAGEEGVAVEVHGVGGVVALEAVDHFAEEAAGDAGAFADEVPAFGGIFLQVEEGALGMGGVLGMVMVDEFPVTVTPGGEVTAAVLVWEVVENQWVMIGAGD